MPSFPISVLLVEDNPGDATLVREFLAPGMRGPYRITHCERLEAALDHLRQQACDVVLLDLSLPDSRGLATFESIRAQAAETPIIILTGFDDDVLAAQAIQNGAQDYLPKGSLDRNLLERSIRYGMDRTRWERSLRQSNEHIRRLEKVESLGRLSAGIAHNFNNLLTVIIGNCDLIVHQPGIAPPLRHRIQVIQDAARRAGSFTRSVMAFGRKLPLRMCDFDINLIITELGPLLQGGVGKDVRFDIALDPQAGRIQADPALIEQTVLNLVLNARDAMPGGGEVAIRTSAADLAVPCEGIPDCVPGGRYAVLSVSDTGRGIDAEDLNRIFEPFYSTKEDATGRGLGLATVYGIVSQNHGFIQVVSQLGAGTDFSIYLPRIDPAVVPPAAEDGQRFSEAGYGLETILLVEHKHEINALLAEALRDAGYKVMSAFDGRSGNALFLQHADSISAVVWDDALPRIDDGSTVAKIRALYPEMPIVVMTGQDGGHDLEVGELNPPVRQLMKPFSPRMLAGTVREELDRSLHGHV
jgi:signal transduction histidine kinase